MRRGPLATLVLSFLLFLIPIHKATKETTSLSKVQLSNQPLSVSIAIDDHRWILFSSGKSMDNLETLPMDLDDAFTSAFKAAGSSHGELIDLEGDEGVKPLADKSKE